MSGPRLVVCGLEPGPAVALAAGALLAAFAEGRAVRPVLLGADLPLWRLLYGAASLTPRVLDLASWRTPSPPSSTMRGRRTPTSPPSWPSSRRSTAGRASRARAPWTSPPPRCPARARRRRARPRRHGRGRGLRRAALARNVEFAGVIVVGGDDQGPDAELRRILERDRRSCPLLGWLPPQLSEQFARQHGGPHELAAPDRAAAGQGRRGGALRGGGRLPRRRRAGGGGHAPRLPAARPRRLLTPLPAADRPHARVALGAAARAVRARERSTSCRPWGSSWRRSTSAATESCRRTCSGLLLSGQLDEDELPAFARTTRSKTNLAAAIGGRPADAGAGRRRPAAAAPPGRQPRPQPRARRRPARRGRTARVVRASAVRARPRRPRQPLRRRREHAVRALRSRIPAARAGRLRLSRGRAPGEAGQAEGFALARCLATTLYPSLAAAPGLAASFVAAMRLRPRRERGAESSSRRRWQPRRRCRTHDERPASPPAAW